MKLRSGQKAPSFEAQDIYDQPISPKKYKGKKFMLSFYRNVACPFCNLRVHKLSKKREAFRAKGLEMVFVFESKPALIKKSIFHQELSPVPIIGDPNHDYYKKYGVEESLLKTFGSLTRPSLYRDKKEIKAIHIPGNTADEKGTDSKVIPADFLIDENGIIQTAYYGTCINDHVPMEQIEAFLKR